MARATNQCSRKKKTLIQGINPMSKVAMQKIGMLLPVSKDSKVKCKTVQCLPCVSGRCAWYTLENGVRVCVEYVGWEPFVWVGEPKANPKGGEVYSVITQNKEANPYPKHVRV